MRRAVLIGLCLLTSCATPVAPSGGPRDETPPELVESVPPSGSVDVDRNSIRLIFSEYIDEQSLARAFSITPAFTRPPEFVWGRRGLEVRFPEDLRENTTYVITLDTELRDIRGVSLSSPITIAFSTGPTISAGKIAGRVVTGRGEPASNVDVFAYAGHDPFAADSLPEAPAYRTQTDRAGAFRFEYLTEQDYFVAALRDQNRNLLPDPQEVFAPSPTTLITADTTPVELGLPWVLTAIDTTRPAPIRGTSLSTWRHRIRFSEPVELVSRDPGDWMLTDSTAAEERPIRQIYTTELEPREIYFTTDPLPAAPHRITPDAAADSAGNPVVRQSVAFTPAAREDTLQLRLLAVLPEGAGLLAAGSAPAVRFNAPPGEERLGRILSVQDSTGAPLSFTAVTSDGTEYAVLPEEGLPPGVPMRIIVDGAELANLDSSITREFTRLPESEVGELSGVVIASSGPVVVEASAVDVPLPMPDQAIRVDSSGRFIFRNLPAGTYRLRAFVDRDADSEWDGGRLLPYQPPEPVMWKEEPERVRARWETALPDTLRIPPPQTVNVQTAPP